MRRRPAAETDRFGPGFGRVRRYGRECGAGCRRRAEGAGSGQAAIWGMRPAVIGLAARFRVACILGGGDGVMMRRRMRVMAAAGNLKEGRDGEDERDHGREPPPHTPHDGAGGASISSCPSLSHGPVPGFTFDSRA